jgi:hypothetical protein
MDSRQDLKQQYQELLRENLAAGLPARVCDVVERAIMVRTNGSPILRVAGGSKLSLSYLVATDNRLCSRENPADHYPARSLILVRGSEERVLTLGRSQPEPSSVAAQRIKPRRR